MHGFQKYANVSLWPKADIATESKSAFFTAAFGEKSGHWEEIYLVLREWRVLTIRDLDMSPIGTGEIQA